MATLSSKQFIQSVLIRELRAIVYEHKFHYLAFGLICSGVEFIGKADDQDATWNTYKRNGYYFKRGLSLLGPVYHKNKDVLYEGLRCSFAHGLIPGKSIGLTHRAEALKHKTTHMTMYKSGLVVIVEDFFDDFEAACKTLLQRPLMPGDKMERNLLAIP
jgi:hypothetical protein